MKNILNMNEQFSQRETIFRTNFKEAAFQIIDLLPKLGILARDFVKDEYQEKYAQLNPEADQRREQNADLRADHSENWHQFGIIGHTRRFVELLDFDQSLLADLLSQWGIKDKLDAYFNQEIDGVRKKDLLLIAGALHDVMKLASPPKASKTQVRDHTDHEAKGEKFIREDKFVKEWLGNFFRLTTAQIDYIARCVGCHFELGKIRRAATREGRFEYNLAYTQSGQCQQDCQQAAAEVDEKYRVEVGLLFLIDSLAKTDIEIGDVNTDKKLEAKEAKILAEIAKRNLNSELKKAILQVPVGIAVAKVYFKELIN